MEEEEEERRRRGRSQYPQNLNAVSSSSSIIPIIIITSLHLPLTQIGCITITTQPSPSPLHHQYNHHFLLLVPSFFVLNSPTVSPFSHPSFRIFLVSSSSSCTYPFLPPFPSIFHSFIFPTLYTNLHNTN